MKGVNSFIKPPFLHLCSNSHFYWSGGGEHYVFFLKPNLFNPFQTGLTAKCMGHSVGEHVKTNLRYLKQKDVAEIAAILS